MLDFPIYPVELLQISEVIIPIQIIGFVIIYLKLIAGKERWDPLNRLKNMQNRLASVGSRADLWIRLQDSSV